MKETIKILEGNGWKVTRIVKKSFTCKKENVTLIVDNNVPPEEIYWYFNLEW